MEAETSQWMMILRTIGSLVLVIGIIYGLRFFAEKYLLNQRLMKSETTGLGPMRVIAQMPIDAKKRLSVVEVKGRQLLIGISEQSINLVADLSDANNSVEVSRG